ncbi:MAG: RNA 2'-phosphotransferase [Actinobacteria bacterium]|nr:RNA 2'-phosphotransferase [Actinomycetota bacterium]MCA1720626.1 RNA 2'-phosphotransferase [Actinomycetota bacterium]
MSDARRRSKRLSYLLRHAPETAELRRDAAGWVDVGELLAALRLTREQLDHVVATNDKQRFAYDDSGRRIRAVQGHSIPVQLGYVPARPPDLLFHGTPERSLQQVLQQGLLPRGRHAVHLSADALTARAVGARRGRPVVLHVDAAGMAAAGFVFTRSTNGVWLVDRVPPEFLSSR